MDNERPIERLLRRYAKKRRDEAGAPVEMHPASRRLLQGEVTRQFRKERSEQTSPVKPSVRWWPRLAYGLCALAVIVVVAAVFTPTLTKRKSYSLEMASVEGRKDNESAAPTLGEAELRRASPPVEVARSEAVQSPALDELKSTKSTDDFGGTMTNSTMLAFADVPHPESPMSLDVRERSVMPGAPADSAAGVAAPATTALPTLNQESTIHFGDPKGYAATAEPILTLAGKSGAEGSQFKSGVSARRIYYNYAQTQAATRFSNMDKSGSKMPVLASFQVEQNGDELRVIDSDGSTYNGNIVPAETLTDTKSDLDYAKLNEKSQVMKKAARAISGEEPRQNMPVQNTFFRLVGTNKTLGQQVIFTGNFVAMTNAGQLQVSAINVSNQAQNLPGQQAFPLLFNNSIIVGRAQLERDRDIEVNAVPVAQ